ncbi:MAG TPA: hypothetical protein VEJ36_01225 [Nitrososphaerales archaeon]|nr:hypothetical protein [Nitrososphaerales archaeon]
MRPPSRLLRSWPARAGDDAALRVRGKPENGPVSAWRFSSLKDYSPLLLAELSILLPGLILPPLASQVPLSQVCRTINLCAGSASPWGVITSIFLYDDWSNFVLLALTLIIFISVHSILPGHEKRRRATYCAAAMFACAITANTMFILVYPHLDSFGPSGVMYAFLGGLIGFAVLNMIHATRGTGYEGSTDRRRSAMMLNGVIVVLVPLFFFFDPTGFLSASMHANAFVHGISLVGGLFSASIYEIPRTSKSGIR